jgi:CBS domain-containing protein
VGSWRARVAESARWLALPWRPMAAAAAIVGAFAIPAAVVTSADLFEEAAADGVTRTLVNDLSPGSAGVVVTARGALGAAAAPLDRLIQQRLMQFGDVTATLSTERLEVELAGPAGDEPIPLRARGRLFARPGAIESLRIVSGEASRRGVWISSTFAAATGLDAGASIVIDGRKPVPVAGVYDDIWAEPSTYWDDVPSEVRPRFLTAFAGPNFELLIVDDAMLLKLAPAGTIRWDTPLADPPSTYRELRATVRDYRELERAFTQDPALVAALDEFDGVPRPDPEVLTLLYDTAETAATVIDGIAQPIAVTELGGIALGLLVTVAGAVFAVRQRATEFRLLAADGDAWWRFTLRALAQYVPPAALGAIVGVVTGWIAMLVAGPTGTARFAVVDLDRVVVVVTIAVAVAAVVTGSVGRRALERTTASMGSFGTAWLFLTIGLAVAGWVQVGAAGRAAEVDPIVVAFPVVGLLAGVGISISALRWLLRRGRRAGRRLPVPAFLAWRRLTSAEAGTLLLTGSIGVALGLAVFTALFVDSLDVAASTKAATAVGAATSAELLGDVDELVLPDASTVVASQTTRVSPGAKPVVVLAVDPATFAAAVDWPSTFGGTAAGLVDRLARDGDDVPAVLVEGSSAPTTGGLGTREVVPYRLVGRVRSAPLASGFHPTLIVRADVLEAVARDRHTEDAGPFSSPMFGYRRTLLSQQDAATVLQATDDAGIDTRDLVTRGERLGSASSRSVAWAFEYLRLLGGLAAVAALGALVLHLAERRAARQVAAVMTEQMGMRPTTARWAAVLELVGLVTTALAAATVTAIVMAGRVFPRFEPEPDLPPNVGLHPSAVLIAAIVAGSIAVVSVTALWSHRAAGTASKAEVLRRG